MDVYDFIDARLGNVIGSWIRGLSKGDLAKFKVKVTELAEMDYELARGTKLLQGPIHQHIYKLKIHGQIMLRPLLCRGPVDNEREYTLLVGAKEENFKLVPAEAPEVAEERRQQVIRNPAERRQIRARSAH